MGATKGGALAAGVLLCAGAGCLSTSSYQTAKMLPQGGTRLSAAVNQYEGHGTDGDGNDQGHGVDGFEVMGSHGLSDKFELGGKIAFLNSEINVFHFLVVPKLSLIPDELAVVVPTGLVYAQSADLDGDGMDDSDSGHFYETLPGLVASHTFNPSVELTGALQLIWLISDQGGANDDEWDSSFYGGLNVGVRLRPPGAVWAIQPELGLSIPISDRDENDVDYILQYGVAFHYDFAGAGATAPVSATPPP